MTNKNDTTKCSKKQYHHLSKKDRIKIETLNNLNYSIAYIAKLIGVHKSTISRELRNRIKSKMNIKFGTIKNLPYSADLAQNDYLF